MRVTTKGRYALRAMLNLAMNGNEKPLSIKKITEVEDLSPIFLEQIFTKLKKHGLIVSVRGAGGGFLLARPAAEISIKDILEAVEEGIRLTPCCSNDVMKAKDCERNTSCQVTGFWNDANEYLMDYFGKISVESIIGQYMTTGEIPLVSNA